MKGRRVVPRQVVLRRVVLRRAATRTILMTTLAGLALTGPAAAQANSLTEAIRAYESGRPDEAIRLLQPLIDGPDEAQARLYLGRIHHGREEWDEAEEHLERAVELEPDDADISYALGLTYLEHISDVSLFRMRGMANKALNTLVSTLYIDPGHVDARVSLAGYYLNAPGIAGGSKDKAREQIQAIIQLDPKRGYLFQAEVYEEDEEWEAARAAYAEALAIAPADAQVLYLSGMFRQGREEWAGASEHFERAASASVTPDTRPFVRSALYQVGRTGALSGQDLDRARDALVEFIDRFPEHEDALSAGARWRLGMIHEMQGDDAAARAAYRDATAIDPDHDEARAALRKIGG